MSDQLVEYSPQAPELDQLERPIHELLWEQPPIEKYDTSILNRWHTFLGGQSVPPDVKSLGLLTTELLKSSAREIARQNVNRLFSGSGYRTSEPTLFAAKLYEDKVGIAFSVPEDYGGLSLDFISIPIEKLNDLTGNLALDLSSECPDIVDALLSESTSPEQKAQARVDLMRIIAKKRPDNVRVMSEAGGLVGSTSLGYTIDNRTAVFKLDASEIPHTDPILGEWVELSQAVDTYYRVSARLERHEYDEMTTVYIEDKLKSLPEWLKKIVLGRHGSAGTKAFRILDFFGKFGYYGNEAQKKFRKSGKMSLALVGIDTEIRRRILSSVADNISPSEAGLDYEAIDASFRQQYSEVIHERLPDNFSISNIVLNRIPLEDLPISFTKST